MPPLETQEQQLPTQQPSIEQLPSQQPPMQQTTVSNNKTDVLGILSIVFFFIFSLVGLILGIIGLHKAKKEGYSRTLSIIGVVLNSVGIALFVLIIPLLVIITFSGIQQKVRDTKRQVDIAALATQLEVYYANYTSYPALAQLQDNAWVQSNLNGLDVAGLVAPNGTGVNTISATASKTTYQYVAMPVGCTTAKRNCTSFTITATPEESGAANIVKESLTN